MKKNILSAHAPCPCGSQDPEASTYVTCCGPFHHHVPATLAPTPEALMRSRYSAYVLGLIDYLLATWHPSTAPGDLELSPLKWLGLEVRHAQEAGDAGVVEFIARYKINGKAERIHETSRFVRVDGRWLYIDGEQHEG
jgi:SEC-C motif-containing protein